MNVYSFTLSLKEETDVISVLKPYAINNVNPYIFYAFRVNNVTISIYQSHKCVVQGNNAENVMKKYFKKHWSQTQEDKLINKVNFNKYKYLIGSDEVGVRDYFGGLVVCACQITTDQISELEALKAQDSKNLNDQQILELAPQIMDKVVYKVASISASEYNILFDKYHNSHVIKTLLHNRAISSLINHAYRNDYYVILDEYANASNYYKYLKTLNEPIQTKIDLFETKAESKYIAVACASIIARYFFLKQIEQLSQNLGMNIPLGAWNSKVESALIELKKKYPNDQWQNYVKFHFKNSLKV